MKKARFGELSTQAIQEIMDKAVPETTKKATKLQNFVFAPGSSHHIPVVSSVDFNKI